LLSLGRIDYQVFWLFYSANENFEMCIRDSAQSISEVGANKLAGIISLGIISTVALVPFFILREISRVIGSDKFWALFFQHRNS